jgi:hypothetical protein
MDQREGAAEDAGVLNRIEPILVKERLLVAYGRCRGSYEASETVAVLHELLIGSLLPIENGPPDRLCLSLVEPDQPRKKFLDAPALGVRGAITGDGAEQPLGKRFGGIPRRVWPLLLVVLRRRRKVSNPRFRLARPEPAPQLQGRLTIGTVVRANAIQNGGRFARRPVADLEPAGIFDDGLGRGGDLATARRAIEALDVL